MILTQEQKACRGHRNWTDPASNFCFTEKGEIVPFEDRFKEKNQKVFVVRWCKECNLKLVFICERG